MRYIASIGNVSISIILLDNGVYHEYNSFRTGSVYCALSASVNLTQALGQIPESGNDLPWLHEAVHGASNATNCSSEVGDDHEHDFSEEAYPGDDRPVPAQPVPC